MARREAHTAHVLRVVVGDRSYFAAARSAPRGYNHILIDTLAYGLAIALAEEGIAMSDALALPRNKQAARRVAGAGIDLYKLDYYTRAIAKAVKEVHS